MLGPAGIAENLGPDNINAEFGKTLHILQEVEDDSDTDTTLEEVQSPEQTFHTAPNTPEQEQTKQAMYISCHAAEGTTGPGTFSLLLMIDGKQAVALVDSGSSDTFMSNTFAVKSNCHQKAMSPKKVTVAGGAQLISNSIVPHRNFSIQDKSFF